MYGPLLSKAGVAALVRAASLCPFAVEAAGVVESGLENEACV
jgi:hypothetical protein